MIIYKYNTYIFINSTIQLKYKNQDRLLKVKKHNLCQLDDAYFQRCFIFLLIRKNLRSRILADKWFLLEE